MTEQTKTDNAHLVAKLNLRRHFLAKYSGRHDVLDCCQGSGAIWSALKKEFTIDSYLGVDVKHKKGRLKIDSLKLCQQSGIIQNVIDVDTYGSPWKHYEAIVQNATRPTTIFLTWGMVRQSGDSVIARAIGIRDLKPKPPQMCLSFLTKWALPFVLGLALERHKVIECKEVVTSSTTARYFGIRLEPLGCAG
ncbi:MAG: hypothetical protein R3C03_24025 [Pirellulaceae bacterium]